LKSTAIFGNERVRGATLREQAGFTFSIFPTSPPFPFIFKVVVIRSNEAVPDEQLNNGGSVRVPLTLISGLTNGDEPVKSAEIEPESSLI